MGFPSGFGYCPRFKKEATMGIYEDLGLDETVNRNNFTKEKAVEVFTKAAEAMEAGELPAEVINHLLDIGFATARFFLEKKI